MADIQNSISSSGAWVHAFLYRLINITILRELDHRYWSFVGSLPIELARLATDRRTIVGDGSHRPIKSVSEIGFLIAVPWAFVDTFPRLDEKQMLDIGEAWLFLWLAVYLGDHIIDKQVPEIPEYVTLQQLLKANACNLFTSIVGENRIFWDKFDQFSKQMEAALKLETHYRVSPTKDFDYEAAWRIGVGKSAMTKVIPNIMAAISNNAHYISNLELSIDALAAGRQLLDDVSDYREDLEQGHYTYPLAQAIKQLNETGKRITKKSIETQLFTVTILEDALHQAQDWHLQSIAAVEGIPCDGWIEMASNSLDECKRYHRDLIIYRVAKAIKNK